MKILTILNEGFEELEALGSLVTFKRASYQVDLVSETSVLKAKHLLTLSNLKSVEDINLDDYDLLFLPGGGYTPSKLTNELILYFYNNNKYIAAICSAPTYLGKLGLLKGRKYVCFPPMNEDFGGTFVDDYVVYDNKIFTARSVAASMILPQVIIETIEGKEKLTELRKQMQYID